MCPGRVIARFRAGTKCRQRHGDYAVRAKTPDAVSSCRQRKAKLAADLMAGVRFQRNGTRGVRAGGRKRIRTAFRRRVLRKTLLSTRTVWNRATGRRCGGEFLEHFCRVWSRSRADGSTPLPHCGFTTPARTDGRADRTTRREDSGGVSMETFPCGLYPSQGGGTRAACLRRDSTAKKAASDLRGSRQTLFDTQKTVRTVRLPVFCLKPAAQPDARREIGLFPHDAKCFRAKR
jgi:hypothetical protein